LIEFTYLQTTVFLPKLKNLRGSRLNHKRYICH